MIIMVVLVGVLGLLVAVLSEYRLWNLRQGGTAAILRDLRLPRDGWRHGVASDTAAARPEFYRPSSPALVARSPVESAGSRDHRPAGSRGDEFDIMTEAIVILELW